MTLGKLGSLMSVVRVPVSTGDVLVFGFWFLFTILSPCGGHPFTGKDLGSCHSTLCFHRDSKVSIDSNDSLRNNTIINKIGNNIRTYPSMHPKQQHIRTSVAGY